MKYFWIKKDYFQQECSFFEFIYTKIITVRKDNKHQTMEEQQDNFCRCRYKRKRNDDNRKYLLQPD